VPSGGYNTLAVRSVGKTRSHAGAKLANGRATSTIELTYKTNTTSHVRYCYVDAANVPASAIATAPDAVAAAAVPLLDPPLVLVLVLVLALLLLPEHEYGPACSVTYPKQESEPSLDDEATARSSTGTGPGAVLPWAAVRVIELRGVGVMLAVVGVLAPSSSLGARVRPAR
jgi:hypothetical protein